MVQKKKEHIGTIRPSDIKLRKKLAPPGRRHKSARDYDRKKLKRQELDAEEGEG